MIGTGNVVKNWYLADENDNKISEPVSGQDFYIWTPKSYGSDVTLSLEYQNFRAYVDFLVKIDNLGVQCQGIVLDADAGYEQDYIDLNTKDNVLIEKQDQETGEKLSNIKLGIYKKEALLSSPFKVTKIQKEQDTGKYKIEIQYDNGRTKTITSNSEKITLKNVCNKTDKYSDELADYKLRLQKGVYVNEGGKQVFKSNTQTAVKNTLKSVKLEVNSVYRVIDPEMKLGEVTIENGCTNWKKLIDPSNLSNYPFMNDDINEFKNIEYMSNNKQLKIKNLPTMGRLVSWMSNEGGPDYEYFAREIENNNYGYNKSEQKEVTLKMNYDTEDSSLNILKIPNTKNTGNLKIVKVDKDTGMKMQGVGFKIKTNTGQYIRAVQNGTVQSKVTGTVVLSDLQYTTDKNAATEFLTDNNGEIRIINLLVGNYVIEETSLGKYVDAYDLKTEGISVNVARQSSTYTVSSNAAINHENIVTITNERCRGNLRIIKVRKGRNEIKLKGVTFTIQDDITGRFVNKASNGTITYVPENQATIFVTDENGEITINNLWAGKHIIHEIGNENDRYDVITEGIEVVVKKNTTTLKTIENKYRWIDISGMVWEDIAFVETSYKDADYNNYYKDSNKDKNDKLISDIPVRLKDSNGKVVINKKGEPCETTTRVYTTKNEDGTERKEIKYLFTYIDSTKLNDYYVEFEYNGMKYESVNINYPTDENEIKNLYSTKKETTSKAGDIKNGDIKTREALNKNYGTINNDSKVDYEGGQGTHESHVIYEKNARYEEDAILDEEKNVENKTTYHGPQEYYSVLANTTQGKYKLTYDYKEGDEIIENVNLGIFEREQPDLSVKKDIYMVKVSIHGKTHIYKYADRMQNVAEYGDGFENTVKFQDKYSNMSYTRSVYASDIMYNNTEDKEDNLKVNVIYQIEMKNQATTLTSKVNQIVDYYDTKYDLKTIGFTEPNDENSYEVRNEINYEGPEKFENDYNKITLNNLNLDIEGLKTKSIYIMLQVSPDSLKSIINEDKEELKLDNVSEITSYTTIKNGEVIAGIDKNSRPGNAIPGDRTTYEDDTDRAPGFKVTLNTERQTTGTVFVDSIVGNTSELMTNKERKGNGLYDENEKGIKNVRVDIIDDKTSKTIDRYDENMKRFISEGAYAITDENGYYSIGGYIPGDYKIKFTWGDGTYKVQDYKGTIYLDREREANTEWYKIDTPYSDAIDDYGIRQNIDETIKEMTNGKKSLIDKSYNSNSESTDIITKMDSYTPMMDVGVEYKKEITKGTEEERNLINNVDFGIVERPKQEISLEKRITNAKLKLANGATLIDAKVKKDPVSGEYRLEDEVNYTTYMPKNENNSGTLKMEIDKEIIQGATLELQYEFIVENISEIDYTDENYYKYGTRPEDDEKLVTLKPEQIIEYLDNQVSTAMEQDKWNKIDDIQKLYQDGLLSKTELEEYLKNVERIFITQLNTDPLKPGDLPTVVAEFTTSKILANSKDITLGNNSEIIKVTKSGGSTLVSTPGNYNPTKAETYENDSGKSEDVVVVPPTGENRDYIMYSIIGIVSLGIIGIGAIIIKKKVLN